MLIITNLIINNIEFIKKDSHCISITITSTISLYQYPISRIRFISSIILIIILKFIIFSIVNNKIMNNLNFLSSRSTISNLLTNNLINYFINFLNFLISISLVNTNANLIITTISKFNIIRTIIRMNKVIQNRNNILKFLTIITRKSINIITIWCIISINISFQIIRTTINSIIHKINKVLLISYTSISIIINIFKIIFKIIIINFNISTRIILIYRIFIVLINNIFSKKSTSSNSTNSYSTNCNN